MNEFTEIMNTWTFERTQLARRIIEIRGEQSGPLSKSNLDKRHDAKMDALLVDAVMRS